MLLKCCSSNSNTDSVFKQEYRNQLIASIIVTLISFSHGINLGWLSPMLPKLQSEMDSPFDWTITVEEASWIGAVVSIGGFSGNFIYCFLLNKIGRKKTLYVLAFPHMTFWILLFFASRVEYLYVARILSGSTGGGLYVVIPLYISEIANNKIRGRLTALFTLSINTGIFVGFIFSSCLSYHLIPCLVIVLPAIYLLLIWKLPETPRYLMQQSQNEKAEYSLKYYMNYTGNTKTAAETFHTRLTELKESVQNQTNNSKILWSDYTNKRAMKALFAGTMLMLLNIFTGSFALINYITTIFAQIKTDLHPDINTIIIGVVQILGTYAAILLVDRCGRRILLLISTTGTSIGMAAFGAYAFLSEEATLDLSSYSSWLPLVLMAFSVFICNIGIVSVTIVMLVELMPVKIRAQATSICLGLLSLFAFVMLRIFPIMLVTLGVAATMWFCASVSALGLFYVAIFIPETKGKSMDKDEEPQ